MMQIAKKKIIGSWLVAFVMLVLSSIVTLAVTSPVVVESSAHGLQSTFEENEVLLNEMTREMNELLVQIEAIHQQGGLPVIDLPLGINIGAFDLLRGFLNGINIPLLVNIGGIGVLNDALFESFTYSTMLSGNLRFPNGILNGSNTVNNGRLPQQSLEAKIAAQEYLLYVTDAIRGALRLILLMDMDENSVDITDMLAAARSFLAFNTNELNQKRDAMYQLFGSETVRLGNIRTVTRNVSRVVRSVDGEGYNLLIDLRNFLLGGQENVSILVGILEYAERMVNGEVIEKYQDLDFDNANVSVDRMFGYLIDDLGEARHALTELDRLTDPLATLLSQAEGEIMELAFSQFPENLEFFMPLLFDDIETVQDVSVYLGTVISVLEDMRAGIQGIDLNEGRRFVTEILSGEIMDRYMVLQEASGQQMGATLRYLKEDVDGVIAALEIADLIDQEFAPLLGDVYLSDLLKEHIIMIAPNLIDTQLELILADFDELDVDVNDLGVGDMVIDLLEPVILSFEISDMANDLRLTSDSLLRLVPIGDRIDQVEMLSTRILLGREGFE